jgi:hypothetical protein
MTMQAQIEQARLALVEVEPRPNIMAVLGAAALAAIAAVLLAGVMILGPGVAIDDSPVPVNAST